jgi:hypothetical protein
MNACLALASNPRTYFEISVSTSAIDITNITMSSDNLVPLISLLLLQLLILWERSHEFGVCNI